MPNGYVLHHKNEDIKDNRFENLELLENGEHVKQHNPAAPDVVLNCAFCGKKIKRTGRDYNFKTSRGQENFFCSASHAAQFGNVEKVGKSKYTPKHGTQGRYRKGCRCEKCRASNTERHRRWREKKQRKKS